MTDRDDVTNYLNGLEEDRAALHALRKLLDPHRRDLYPFATEGPNRKETDAEVLDRLFAAQDAMHLVCLTLGLDPEMIALQATSLPGVLARKLVEAAQGGTGPFKHRHGRLVAVVKQKGRWTYFTEYDERRGSSFEKVIVLDATPEERGSLAAACRGTTILAEEMAREDAPASEPTDYSTRSCGLSDVGMLRVGDRFNTALDDGERANRLLPVGSRVYAVLGSYCDSITRTSDGWRVDAVAPLPCRRALPPLVGGHYEVVRVGPEKRELSVGDKVTDADAVPCGLVVAACDTIDYRMDEVGRWAPAPLYTGPTSDTLRALSSEPFFVRHVPRAAPPLTRLRIGDVMEGPDGSRRLVICEGESVINAHPTKNPDGTISLAPGVRRVGNIVEGK